MCYSIWGSSCQFFNCCVAARIPSHVPLFTKCPPLRGGAGRGFSMSDKVAVLKEHVLSAIAWCGNDERKGILHSRRHFAASPVFKGLPDFKQTRIALLRADTKEEVFAIMDSIVAQWGNG